MFVPLNDLGRTDARSKAQLGAAFRRVVDRGHFVLGPEVQAFEEAFAAYCGVAHCVGVANGSDALEIALRAAGVRPGHEVATVANAAMYSTLAILACGATPVYADVADDTLTMAADTLAPVLTERTRAVVVTHLYGYMADVPAIRAALAGRRIAVVEDCAQAHGASLGGARAGSLGDLASFSFYPTKNLGALGDGGAIVSHDPDLAARVKALRQYGWDAKYHVAIGGGRNSRLDEVQAAVLRERLPALDAGNARRREIVQAYAEGIRHADIRVQRPAGERSVAHLAVVRSRRRDALREHLRASGVGTDVHYPVPDHRQPVMQDRAAASLPVTEQACREVLSLPCFAALRDDEVRHVVAACNAWPA